MSKRVLFICKNRNVPYSTIHKGDDVEYSEAYCDKKSSGLVNSVKFVVDMLKKNGVECKMVDVVDNNAIDREVTLYKPTNVIIEALWVIPEKFEVLTKLHPKVKWTIRLHSELPFIAGEGVAMDWIYRCISYKNVDIACNSKRIADSLSHVLKKPVSYMPNYYDVDNVKSCIINPIRKFNNVVDIGCFGAIRPLKNQFIQAVAALHFSWVVGRKLRFHINASRVEGKGENNLKNIRKLFEGNKYGAELVEHEWMNHEVFTGLISQMDVTMQVSFSETYNIVTADAIAQDVPVVTSHEIDFVFPLFKADTTSTDSMIWKLLFAYYLNRIGFSKLNKLLLRYNSWKSKRVWLSLY